jgi:hypothetical protein
MVPDLSGLIYVFWAAGIGLLALAAWAVYGVVWLAQHVQFT